MNWPGGTRPWVGCRQRTRLRGLGVAALDGDDGLVVDLEFVPLDGPAQVGFDLEVVVGGGIHRRLEVAVGVAPAALAWYMAVSALRISESTVLPSRGRGRCRSTA